jgi:hypothetical protein
MMSDLRSLNNEMYNWLSDDPEIFVKVEAKDVKSMVAKVLAAQKRQGRRIDKLFFVGHGAAGGMPIGQEWVGLKEIDSVPGNSGADHRSEFQRIGKVLSNGAEVYFLSCNLGKGNGEKTLIEFSKLFGCPVFGCDYFRVGGSKMEDSANLVCTPQGCRQEWESVDVGKYILGAFSTLSGKVERAF